MDIKPQIRIRIDTDDKQTSVVLKRLADNLGLPDPDKEVGVCDFYFILNDDRLELHRNDVSIAAQSPLCVDFLVGSAYYRFVNDRTIRQPLAKAVGIKQGYRPTVLDTTAGFGEDSFVLAALGCTVTMLERSPLIWALLSDGIRRSRSHHEIGRIFEENVELLRADSQRYLSEGPKPFDTIYVDPMYPHRKKSSLNKQKMRWLRTLVGDDVDSSGLLHAALSHADKRVVVKRPAGAEVLAGLEPSYTVTAKSCRYDIYLAPS